MASRVTRSSTRSAMPPPSSPVAPKRTASAVPATPPPKKPRKAAPAPDSPYVPPTPRTQQAIVESVERQREQGEKEGTVLLHPELKFNYPDAKHHLIQSDPRWKPVMDQLECKPFQGEQSDPFDPFKSLVSSILGQQVSWMAARSIQHKFCRIWAPHLPEKLPPPDSAIPRVEDPFPTPQQVLATPDRRETLRAAGLSYRKVEYVVELAERFHDGRLDAKRLWDMEDDEVLETLTAVRGIGVWTVHMFLIFSMKRQDILPVGDLGIQKNLCRWYSYDPSFVPSIHPRKLVGTPSKESKQKQKQKPKQERDGAGEGEGDEEEAAAAAAEEEKDEVKIEAGVGKLDELGAASVERDRVVRLDEATVAKHSADDDAQDEEEKQGEAAPSSSSSSSSTAATAAAFPATSNGLTPQVLKSRLAGNKVKAAGGAKGYLTPTEMQELMKPWEPYRSIACWYLWSVTDKE
ncbi:hypothetical protein JCM11491_001410 [Sporobolomyces phaffii]